MENRSKKQVILVDGSGYLHRAYHAVRDLSTSTGIPTNAVYGVLSMLKKIEKDMHPQYIAVVMDKSRHTFRNDMYPQYKANRPPAPQDLVQQFALVRQLIEALGYPMLEMDDYEADDIMGTLARQAVEQGWECVILTGDKDLAQVVTEDCRLYDAMRDRWMDPEGVQERFGVRPEQIVDYLALVGDQSDNVPGVKGIGAKGAAKLLQQYGSLEHIYEHIDELPARTKQALQQGRDNAFLSKKLVQLRLDSPVGVGVDELQRKPVDREALKALLTRLEFHSALREFGLDDGDGAKYEVTVVKAASEFDEMLAMVKDAGVVTLVHATDCQGPRHCTLRFLGVSTQQGRAWSMNADEARVARLFKALHGKQWVCNEFKVLYEATRQLGLEITPPTMSTDLASYLLAPHQDGHALDRVLRRFGVHLTDGDQSLQWVGQAAAAVQGILPKIQEQLAGQGLEHLLKDVEMPLAEVLARMELTGMAVDPSRLAELSKEVRGMLQNLEAGIYDAAGGVFNIGSPKQLAEVLFNRLGLPPKRKTKTGYSTDNSVLEALQPLHPLPGMVIEYRGLSKLKSTYIDVLPRMVDPRTGRIHTTFHQTVTATGRLSSSDPNLQNIPIRTKLGKRIREAFVAPAGKLLLSLDYSQVELRVMAHLSGDATLRQSFLDNEDIHRRTAALIFDVDEDAVTPDMRRAAKTVNFGIMYGMSAFRLANDLGISRKEAKGFIEQYFNRLPGVAAFIEDMKEQARQQGYVSTLLGRRRPIEGINDRNRIRREFAERTAVNTPVQGSAADIIKVAMVNLDRALQAENLPAKLILQVHDELILEVDETAAEQVANTARECMVGAVELSVPLRVDIGVGRTWAQVHD